jgi:hypothetical protein
LNLTDHQMPSPNHQHIVQR